MCRMMWIRAPHPVALTPFLEKFAQMARQSQEYQGHGWGIAYRTNGEWHRYRTVSPVWKDTLTQFGVARECVVHARSAFRDRDIVVENNMPFVKEDVVFAFNGELQGVRLAVPGRTGAHKIFHLFHRFYNGNLQEALGQLLQLLEQKSRYIRACNIIVSNGKQAAVASLFNENPTYFSLREYHHQDFRLVVSEPLAGLGRYRTLPNRTIKEYPL